MLIDPRLCTLRVIECKADCTSAKRKAVPLTNARIAIQVLSVCLSVCLYVCVNEHCSIVGMHDLPHPGLEPLGGNTQLSVAYDQYDAKPTFPAYAGNTTPIPREGWPG